MYDTFFVHANIFGIFLKKIVLMDYMTDLKVQKRRAQRTRLLLEMWRLSTKVVVMDVFGVYTERVKHFVDGGAHRTWTAHS